MNYGILVNRLKDVRTYTKKDITSLATKAVVMPVMLEIIVSKSSSVSFIPNKHDNYQHTVNVHAIQLKRLT